MKLTEIFNKGLKNVETTEKALEKAQKEYEAVQAGLQEKQQHKQKLSSAMNTIEASLIIDPNDKNAKAQKEKGEKKLHELDKEIAKLNEKFQKAQEALTNATKELKNSKGEVFKQKYISVQAGSRVFNMFDKMKGRIEAKIIKAPSYNWVDWSKGYGLPLDRKETRLGTSYLREKPENVPFLKAQQREAEKLAHQKAEELITKIEKAIEDILAEEGIKFKD